LQARGEIGSVADRRRIHPQIAANRAEHDQAGMDADADLELRPSSLSSGADASNGFADCQRRQ
jgi:hypothetical protein